MCIPQRRDISMHMHLMQRCLHGMERFMRMQMELRDGLQKSMTICRELHREKSWEMLMQSQSFGMREQQARN